MATTKATPSDATPRASAIRLGSASTRSAPRAAMTAWAPVGDGEPGAHAPSRGDGRLVGQTEVQALSPLHDPQIRARVDAT